MGTPAFQMNQRPIRIMDRSRQCEQRGKGGFDTGIAGMSGGDQHAQRQPGRDEGEKHVAGVDGDGREKRK